MTWSDDSQLQSMESMFAHIWLLTYVCAHTPGMHEESKNWVSKDFFFHVTLKQDSATSIYIVTTYARYCRSFSYDLKVATDVHGFYAKWYVVYMRDLSIQSLCTLGMTWSACVKLTTVSEHHWFFVKVWKPLFLIFVHVCGASCMRMHMYMCECMRTCYHVDVEAWGGH